MERSFELSSQEAHGKYEYVFFRHTVSFYGTSIQTLDVRDVRGVSKQPSERFEEAMLPGHSVCRCL